MPPTLAPKDKSPMLVLRNDVGKSSLPNKYKILNEMAIANLAIKTIACCIADGPSSCTTETQRRQHVPPTRSPATDVPRLPK
eukprot:CAMPEP_0172924952 /NCGR_PEP_ID=MMETSP1075-20121228/212681_1 /TAXON_ID=2916 /ORGANISM="Ceratium fusus, Strain PA161109" /LENGTH=81 /DNA_ID=CAMNT_0013785721 /DNA_START=8 /DNA_END=250 /DNA_ORIENTATION=+